jgi:hypothetical protein
MSMSDLERLGSSMTQDPHDQWVPGLAPTHEISWKPTVSARAVNRLTVDYRNDARRKRNGDQEIGDAPWPKLSTSMATALAKFMTSSPAPA